MLNIRSIIGYMDLKLLMWPLLGFIVVVSGSVLLQFVVRTTLTDTRVRIDDGNVQLANVRTLIAEIAQEESTVIRYIGQYLSIDRSGAFKQEDRLALLQMLDSLRTRLGLFPISVSIDNQQQTDTSLKYPQNISGGPLFLSGSRLTLRIPLAHEGYLIRFLEEFQRYQSLSVLESCALDMTEADILTATNFSAECTINWVTFDFENTQQELANASATEPIN
jgi:hypothetical protein